MRTEDYHYQLPANLVAVHPSIKRDAARLLVLHRDAGAVQHEIFRDLPRLLRPGSLLVLNDTRVIPARLRGHKPTGGAVELLLVRRLDGGADTATLDAGDAWSEDWDALARGLGPIAIGTRLTFGSSVTAVVSVRGDRGRCRVTLAGPGRAGLLPLLEDIGAIPLPPYIESARRKDIGSGEGVAGSAEEADRVRYQTVYARQPGAVAAPTAGLHFTDELLRAVVGAGHEIARLTLHVGPGTFRPIEVEDPEQHEMDAEPFDVPEETAAAVTRARAAGRPVVAVGTTVVRTLETVATETGIRAGAGDTRLFLRPGSRFRVVTDLITNFHLPRSTLLMLVAAFAGRERVLAAYEEAVQRAYRFYSYGDAMFITGGAGAPRP